MAPYHPFKGLLEQNTSNMFVGLGEEFFAMYCWNYNNIVAV